MITQSRLDCKKELVEKHGLDGNTSEFVHIWDLHYKHETGQPFKDELKIKIKEIFPDKNQNELYHLFLRYFEDAKKRRRFFRRNHPYGYGYEVIDRNGRNFAFKLHTYDKEKAETYLEALKLDENAIAPDTSDEVPPAKILVINEHHGPLYFKADTPEMFIKKSVDFILEYNNFYGPETNSIKDILGMTEEEVNEMPEGNAKEVVKSELIKLKDREEENLIHISAWDTISKIRKLKEKSTYRDIETVLDFYIGEKFEGGWDIVKLL